VLLLLPPFFACAVSAVATVIDLRQRRIPNWLTYPTTLIGLGFHAFVTHTLSAALVSGAFAAVVFFPMWWMKGIGGGDAKLALALGCVLGSFEGTARFLLLTTVAGAFYALLATAREGQLSHSWKRLVSKQARKDLAPITIAYAPAFLLGALGFLAWQLA